MNHRDILKNALRQNLLEKPTTFDAVTDLIERCAGLVKELGGLHVPEISDLDRALIGKLIEQQVQLGIERGDFDFVFRTGLPPAIDVPEFKIARLDLGPDDAIVLKVDAILGNEDRDMVTAVMRDVFPEPRKIIVIGRDIEISIVKEST